MIRKPRSRQSITVALVLTVSAVVICAFATASAAQAPTQRAGAENTSTARGSSVKVYEDDEVQIRIPAGWTVATGAHPAVAPYDTVGSSIVRAKGRLLLSKSRYTLALAYDTQHASGIIGGRFIEVLRIPWLSADDAWNCSLHVSELQQPASGTLRFVSIVFHTSNPEVREKCGIEKDLGYRAGKGKVRQIVGEERWFAGYFTTADGGCFFQSHGVNCGEKAYTLTSNAKTPGELPVVGDARLKRVIAQAIGIIDSIDYKRCAPAAAQ